MHLSIPFSAFCLALGAHLSSGQVTANCPLLGPVFPAPTAPATASAVNEAQASFAGYLNGLLGQGTTEFGPLDNLTTSFSINIFSSHDNNSLFSYQYAAPGLNGSLTSGHLDDNTMYRVGSLSKLLTVYTILAEVGDTNLDDPVTKYVPELAAAAAATGQNTLNSIRWSEVTIRALASHMSGIPRDCMLF
jgi:CubicO group peptidase (beta-lactamase class C family)